MATPADPDAQLRAEREVLGLQAQLRESFRQTADVSIEARREQIRLAEQLIEREKDLMDQGKALARVRAEEKKAEADRQRTAQAAITRTATLTQGAMAATQSALAGAAGTAGQFGDAVGSIASSFGPWGAAAGTAVKAVTSVIDALDERTRRMNQAVVSTFAEVLSGSRSAGSAVNAIRINTLQEGFTRAASAAQSFANPGIWDTFRRAMVPGAMIGEAAMANPEVAMRDAERNAQAMARMMESPEAQRMIRTIGTLRGREAFGEQIGRNLPGGGRERGALETQMRAQWLVGQQVAAGGTMEEAQDAAREYTFVQQRATAAGMTEAEARVTFAGEIAQMAEQMRHLRNSTAATQLIIANRTPMENFQMGLRRITEAAPWMTAEQTERARGAAARAFIEQNLPAERFVGALEQGSVEAATTIAQSIAQERRADPAEALRAAIEAARAEQEQLIEVNRRLAAATEALLPTGSVFDLF